MNKVVSIPGSFDELITRVSARYPSLSRRLQQIAQYALANPNDMALETIAVIAGARGCTAVKFNRFAKTFGYEGFSDMQRLFRDRLMQHVPSYGERIRVLKKARTDSGSILDQFAEAAVHGIEHLRRETLDEKIVAAIDLMAKARSIHVAAQRRAFPAAVYFAYLLSHLDRPAHLIDGIGGLFFEQLRSAEKGDALAVISFHEYAPDIIEAAALAHKKGIPVLAITDNKLSPLAPIATVCLEVEEAQVGHFRSLSATMCLILSLAVALGARRRS
ncbi:MAG: MurR/RpiR family transcriptional regulator [Alphaproteobacteria bacterium]